MRFPADCYACYYMLFVRPGPQGEAIFSTCCTNVEKQANNVSVYDDVCRVWNHPAFQYQRKLTSERNWSYCVGATCMPYRLREDFVSPLQSAEVRNAIENKICRLEYLPKFLWITPSYVCNNRCPFCYQKYQETARFSHAIKKTLLEHIMQKLVPQADLVVFTGGEPFLTHPDSIGRAAALRTVRVGVGTNGTCLHEYGIQRLVDQRIRLSISVYGFEEKEYNRITRSDNYDLFHKNLDALLEANYAEQITLDYMVYSRASLKNVVSFLTFVRNQPLLRALIRDNHWGDTRYQKELCRLLRDDFPDLAERVKIYFRGMPAVMRMGARCYNRCYDWQAARNIKGRCAEDVRAQHDTRKSRVVVRQ